MYIRLLDQTDSLEHLTNLIHRAYARLGDMGLNYTAVDQSVRVTEERIRGGSCFVTTAGNKFIGTILVQPTYAANECEYFTRPGVAAAHQFAVDPAHQGKGIGRALLQHAEHWAAQSGYRELAMDTAEPASHLIELYNRLGYEHVGWVQWTGKTYRSVVLSKRVACAGLAACARMTER